MIEISIQAENLEDLEEQFEALRNRLFAHDLAPPTVEAVVTPALTAVPAAVAVVAAQPIIPPNVEAAQAAAIATADAPPPPLTVPVPTQPALPGAVPTAAASVPLQPIPGPAPTVPAAAPAVAGGEMDSAGRPWDERIHTQAKTKLKTGAKAGQWRLKRGADKALVAQIEGQPATGTPAPVTSIPGAAASVVDIVSKIITAAGGEQEKLIAYGTAVNSILVQCGLPTGSAAGLEQHPELAPAALQLLTVFATENGIQC